MIDFTKIKRIHCIGVTGVGLSGVAKILKEMGKDVTGSDVAGEEFITSKVLKKAGIPVAGFSIDNITGDLDLVIVGTSWTDNEEAKKAAELKIPMISESEARASFMQAQKGIAVAGVHGKTTVSAIIAHLMIKGGMDPSFLVGTGVVPTLGENAHFGKGDYYVVEADEYYKSPQDPVPKFLDMDPYIGLITSIDFDHPDVFPDLAAVKDAFAQFIEKIRDDGQVVAYGDNEMVRELLAHGTKRHQTYGLEDDNDWQAKNIKTADDYTTFRVIHKDQSLGEFKMHLFGYHNVANALAAIVVAYTVGLSIDRIKELLADFQSPERRFDVREVAGITFLDDYAHHPTAIKTTWQTIKEQFPDKKIWFVFHPHTYSRTEALLPEFAEVLAEVDQVYLLDIFSSAREKKGEVGIKELVAAIQEQGGHPQHLGSVKDGYEYLQDKVKPGDLVVTMGAGDVYKIRDMFDAARRPAVGAGRDRPVPWPAGVEVRENVSLAPYTTFQIGGPARFLAKAQNEDELIQLIKTAQENNIPFYILGGGSNVLVADEGFAGLIIKIAMKEWRMVTLGREFKKGEWQRKEQLYEFGAGMKLSDVIGFTAKNGLTGLEYAAGIPGTLGGAIYGNAEAFQKELSDLVISVKDYHLKGGNGIRERQREDLWFGYRYSNFKRDKDSVIVSVVLRLKPAESGKVMEAVKTVMAERKKRAVKNTKSAGCFFQNIPLDKASPDLLKRFEKDMQKGAKFVPTGLLIDRAGMKGKKVGGAMIALEHGNYILNQNDATAADILVLAEKVKEAVKKKYGVELAEEVQLIGLDDGI